MRDVAVRADAEPVDAAEKTAGGLYLAGYGERRLLGKSEVVRPWQKYSESGMLLPELAVLGMLLLKA